MDRCIFHLTSNERSQYVNYLYCYPYKLEVCIALENIKTSTDNLKTCRAKKELNLTNIRFVIL